MRPFFLHIAPIARDLVGIAGAIAIARGAGLIYPPAAWIVAGVMMLGGAYLLARHAA